MKNQKNTKTVCYVYIGTCVPWMAIETKFSKLCVICSLDEHLYTQLSKWALWLLFVMSNDSTDEYTDVLDEVTMTKVRWQVKGSATPDGDTESFNTSKHSRRLPSQAVKPLEPIKAPLLGKGVTSVALTTHNG